MPSRLPAIAIPLLGLLLVVGAGYLARLPGLAGQGANLALLLGGMTALFAGALFLVRWLGRRGGAPAVLSLPVLLAVGLLIRLPLVAAPPRLSDDIYRFVWDGRVAAAGVNPFRHAPADTALAALRDGDWGRINNPRLPTIYPPVAQGLFRLGAGVAPGVTGLKVLLLLADLGLALLLAMTVARGVADRWRLVLYWWHPLMAIEWGWSGHADVLGMFFLALAFVASRERPGEGAATRQGWAGAAAAGALAALATLVKFLALPALPFLVRRRHLLAAAAFLVTAALLYVPFVEPGVNPFGSLGTYASKWRANDFFFGALVRPGTAMDQDARLTEAKLYAAAFVLGVAILALLLRAPRAGGLVTVLGTAVLVSPTVHPWYLAWIVPFLAFHFSAAWFYATLAVLLAYQPLPAYLAGAAWSESWALKAGATLPFLVLAARDFRAFLRGRDRA